MRTVPCTTEEFPRPAPRPAYSVLGSERTDPIRLPDWREGLRELPGGEGAGAMRLLVTGAAGFIGSTYVRVVLESGDEVVVLDKLTYAGRRENLQDVEDRIEFVEGAIEDRDLVREVMEGCDAVVNFAAESHVDRSIADQDAFARTHVIGTSVLLDAAREHGVGRYLQVSTDEVYGSIERGSFTETSPLNPSSPYSATKAAGDLLVSAHVHTYGIEAVICRGSNNYGPRQYPEKLIPLCVLNALAGDRCRSTATATRCATGSTWRTSRARSTWRCARACRARSTTSAARTRPRTSTWCAASWPPPAATSR